jgi:hypothetical protein
VSEQDGKSELSPGVTSDDALVVLTVAAATAYFYVTDSARQVESGAPLAQILPLVAIALSTVAPIRRADGTPLSEVEVDELLFRRQAGVGARATTLAQLRIRRGELDKAMALLKEARVAFTPSP